MHTSPCVKHDAGSNFPQPVALIKPSDVETPASETCANPAADELRELQPGKFRHCFGHWFQEKVTSLTLLWKLSCSCRLCPKIIDTLRPITSCTFHRRAAAEPLEGAISHWPSPSAIQDPKTKTILHSQWHLDKGTQTNIWTRNVSEHHSARHDPNLTVTHCHNNQMQLIRKVPTCPRTRMGRAPIRIPLAVPHWDLPAGQSPWRRWPQLPWVSVILIMNAVIVIIASTSIIIIITTTTIIIISSSSITVPITVTITSIIFASSSSPSSSWSSCSAMFS